MSELKTTTLRGGDFTVKYYQEGRGEPLVFLHSAGGLPTFTPELKELSKRFAVTAPLLPAFGSTGEEHLHEDVQKLVFWGWDLLDALKIDRPILVGHSFGGMMAAEMAATEPGRVKKLVLVAPAGLYLEAHPMLDIFACSPDKLVRAAFHDPTVRSCQSLHDAASRPERRDRGDRGPGESARDGRALPVAKRRSRTERAALSDQSPDDAVVGRIRRDRPVSACRSIQAVDDGRALGRYP